MTGSCRVSASAALHDGSSSCFRLLETISGYSSPTVNRRFFFLRFAELLGCPRTNCPLAAFPGRANTVLVIAVSSAR